LNPASDPVNLEPNKEVYAKDMTRNESS